MTVLVLANRKIRNLLPKNNIGNFGLDISLPTCLYRQVQSKFLFFSFLAISISAIAVYLWSLYFTFQAGFILREQGTILDKLGRETKLQEIKASGLDANLVKDSGIMASMEKISSMRYIKTSSEVSYK